MRTFRVKGTNWQTEIEVDNEIYEKYGDMAMEAMTQAFDAWSEGSFDSEGKDAQLGFVMTSCEKGHEGNADKEMACLTALVAENAGEHSLASEMRVAMNNLQDGDGYGSYE